MIKLIKVMIISIIIIIEIFVLLPKANADNIYSGDYHYYYFIFDQNNNIIRNGGIVRCQVGDTVTLRIVASFDTNIRAVAIHYTDGQNTRYLNELEDTSNDAEGIIYKSFTAKAETPTDTTCYVRATFELEGYTTIEYDAYICISGVREQDQNITSEAQDTRDRTDANSASITWTSNQIISFMAADYGDNREFDLTEELNIDILRNWREKMRSEMQNNSNLEDRRREASVCYDVLNSIITGTELSEEQLSNIDETLNDTNDRVREIRSQYLSANIDEGQPRNAVPFVDILEHTDDYIPEENISQEDANKLQEKTSMILTTITNIGLILSVLIPVILGIKYMLGSIEEKAEYKKDMVPYLVGAVLLFGVTSIARILQEIGKNINNS